MSLWAFEAAKSRQNDTTDVLPAALLPCSPNGTTVAVADKRLVISCFQKRAPEKGWSAHALSFDLPVFTCHGYCVSRAGGGEGQPEGNGSWVAGKEWPMEGGSRRAAGLRSK